MAEKNQPSFSPGRRWKNGFDVCVRTALVLAVVVMVNYLGATFSRRFHLGAEAQQLSSRTLNIVHSLTNQIAVTVYYDKSDEWYPAIVALLNEYQSANPDISVKTVDYALDGGAAEKTKEQYQRFFNSQGDKNLIIFDAGGNRVRIVPGDGLVQTTLQQIPNEDPNDKRPEFTHKPLAFNGELAFTSVLLALENAKPFKAYFLQGHGEGSLNDSGNFGYLKFATALAQNYIAPINLELDGDAVVPADCNLLIIAAPTAAIPENELKKISDYLDQGGRLFALFDFHSINQPTGLEPVLQRWGIYVVADYVKDLNHTITGQDVIIRKFGQHPVIDPLAQFQLQMILPRPVETVNLQSPAADAPQVTALAFSSPDSTLAGDSTAAPQSYPLIAAVEQKAVPGVASTRGGTRIIVAGDSVFLGNHYIEGGEGGANRDFVSYAANWLLDRPALLNGVGPRPVTVFRLMMTQAQQNNVRWLLLGALPGGVLAFGWLVWLARRK